MATITKVQLRERIASHLKIASPDMPLDAANAQKIDDALDDATAELREKGLCWWPENAIPQACVFAMTLIVSAQACAKVGKAGQGYEPGDSDGRSRLAQLKPSADIKTLQPEYY